MFSALGRLGKKDTNFKVSSGCTAKWYKKEKEKRKKMSSYLFLETRFLCLSLTVLPSLDQACLQLMIHLLVLELKVCTPYLTPRATTNLQLNIFVNNV